MATPWELLEAELRRDGSRPFLTFYDAATSERVELSVTTTANWVAKTANFLVDELGTDPGDTIAVQLPLHWYAAVFLLAAWAAGLEVVDAEADIVVTSQGSGDSGARETIELTFAEMGLDLSRLVAAQPDVYVPIEPRGADEVELAAPMVADGARMLVTDPLDAGGRLSALLAPLMAGGSVVYVRNSDAADLDAIAATERVTLRRAQRRDDGSSEA